MAELILSVFTAGYSDEEDQHTYEVAGAMLLADAIVELTRIRKMMAKTLKG